MHEKTKRRALGDAQRGSDDRSTDRGERTKPESYSMADVLRDGQAFLDALQRVALVRVLRLRARLRRGVFLAVFAVWGGVMLLAISITASIVFVRGAAAGLSVLAGDREWVGDIGAAVLILAALACGLWLSYRIAARRSARRNRARLQRAAREKAE